MTEAQTAEKLKTRIRNWQIYQESHQSLGSDAVAAACAACSTADTNGPAAPDMPLLHNGIVESGHEHSSSGKVGSKRVEIPDVAGVPHSNGASSSSSSASRSASRPIVLNGPIVLPADTASPMNPYAVSAAAASQSEARRPFQTAVPFLVQQQQERKRAREQGGNNPYLAVASMFAFFAFAIISVILLVTVLDL